MPRKRSRPRPATPTRIRPETLDPEAEGQRRRACRVGRHRRAGPRAWRWRSRPGSSSRTRSPRNRWSRRSTSASGCWSTASSTTSRDPSLGDIVVFHPPAGADNGTECGVAAAKPGEAVPAADRGRVESELHQADRRRAGRHALGQRRPSRRQRRREDRRALHHPLRRRRRLQLAADDHDPARPLLHDGRQPWSQRRQPLLGTRSPQTGSSARPLPPTGHPTASASSKSRSAPPPAGPQPPPVRLRSRSRRAASSPAPTRPAAAAWPARWSPPRC